MRRSVETKQANFRAFIAMSGLQHLYIHSEVAAALVCRGVWWLSEWVLINLLTSSGPFQLSVVDFDTAQSRHILSLVVKGVVEGVHHRLRKGGVGIEAAGLVPVVGLGRVVGWIQRGLGIRGADGMPCTNNPACVR